MAKIWTSIKEYFTVSQEEKYLRMATDHRDLERRLEALRRGSLPRFYQSWP